LILISAALYLGLHVLAYIYPAWLFDNVIELAPQFVVHEGIR